MIYEECKMLDVEKIREDFPILSRPVYGRPLLEKDQALMEIKVGHGMPLWLVHYLTEHKIYRTSYSKYGNAYRTIVTEKNESKGELEHVS